MEEKTYTWWNEKLAKYFFNSDKAGQRVYLSITEQIIKELGAKNIEEFTKQVRRGPADIINNKDPLCVKALTLLKLYKEKPHKFKDLEFPPYIAFLCLFVLAFNRDDDDFSDAAYYPRLKKLTNENNADYKFGEIGQIWQDLEHWSKIEKKGDLGIFKTQLNSYWVHVWQPMSQVILSEGERKSLPIIFNDAGLIPNLVISDRQLNASLYTPSAKKLLSKRTLRLLDEVNRISDSKKMLFEVVRDEFQSWNGEINSNLDTQNINRTKISGIRLCLTLDQTAKRINTYLRCQYDFVNDDDTVSISMGKSNWVAYPAIEGWSAPICDRNNAIVDAAAEIDWMKNLDLLDKSSKTRFKFTGRPIRIFISGAGLGLDGLVESEFLQKSCKCYFLVHIDHIPFFQNWGKMNCRALKTIDIKKGLPDKFVMYSTDSVFSDTLTANESVNSFYSNLGFNRNTIIKFVGGLKVKAHGNTYFSWAKPKILLLSDMSNEIVKCNDQVITQEIDSNLFILPSNLAEQNEITVLTKDSEALICRRNIQIIDDFDEPVLRIENGVIDKFGKFCSVQINSLTDAKLQELRYFGDIKPYNYFPNPTTYKAKKIIFLGQTPGQIFIWQGQKILPDWTPVWAITHDRKPYIAHFCGFGIADSAPNLYRQQSTNDVKEWHDLIWHERKKIQRPKIPVLAKLWDKYVEVARHG